MAVSDVVPRDLLDQGMETLLEGMGIPPELFKGATYLGTPKTAINQFEAQWRQVSKDQWTRTLIGLGNNSDNWDKTRQEEAAKEAAKNV